jgi:TRAP transporter 4TM/12TM fusion protein
LFGSFLAKSGAGQLFVDLAMAVSGKHRSAPARATIISNALMGIISGSPVANVVTTGAFAIPLLNKAKYPKVRGAALLAVASIGSMFTPPVMGAAAFLIADFLGVDYGKVIIASLIPAALFYISLIVTADIGAIKGNLTGLAKEDLPDGIKAIKEKGQMLIPVILLVVLIVSGWSATKSAFWCILLIIGLSLIRKSTRMSFKNILDAIIQGSKDTMPIAAACACAGIIVGVVSATGIGVKFSSLLINLSANSVLPSLFLTMIAALILGMGLPPTAVYIILAALTVPALIKLGIAPMAAHFFVFYFSCVGAITPPVALAAYSSSALAKTDPWKTGWVAFRMGAVAYIIPFIFAYNPVLLLQGHFNVFWAVTSIISVTIGIIFINYGIEGYFKAQLSWPVRILFIIGAVLLMVPDLLINLAGLIVVVCGYLAGRFLFKGKPYENQSSENNS